MAVLIVYGTKYGCTEKCAKILAEKLNGEVDLCNLKERELDLSKYEKVIIGGSVYMGRIRKEVSQFITKNLNALKGKKLGLYICCMRDGDDAKSQVAASFPQELLHIAAAKDYFGGEFIFKKMNAMERFIVKKVSKVSVDTSYLRKDSISKFAQLMNA